MAFTDRYVLFILNGLLLCLFILLSGASNSPFGYTVPNGDIVLEYGQQSLNITCTAINESIAKSMYFTRGGYRFKNGEYKMLNATSIQLYISKPARTADDTYYCAFKSKNLEKENLVAMNAIAVGTRPQNVTDFSCISLNYDNLTCTWTPPENYVKTDYNLQFSVSSRGSRYASCPTPHPMFDGKRMSCFWNISTQPQYRQSHKKIRFYLTANNTFGNYSLGYEFHNFENVLPNKPENLTGQAVTTNTIRLNWSVPSSMQSFPPGVHHRIMYQCVQDKQWNFAAIITDAPKNRTLEYYLHGIKYGYIFCDIRVSIRSANAIREDMWSQNATFNLRTLSTIPYRPPRTDIGSFELEYKQDTRDAFIYWSQIDSIEANGPSLTYQVKVEGHHELEPKVVSKAYAKFVGLKNDISYRFKIWSKNSIGLSANYSIVDVPKMYAVPEPIEFRKKTVSDSSGHEHHTLYWTQPNSTAIESYTIFWCRYERDRPQQCDGTLDWANVPKGVNSYNKTVKGIHQFAISANTDQYSSGMKWADCLLSSNNVARIDRVYSTGIHAQVLQIGWDVSCGTINGYHIYYCPVVNQTQKCKEPTRNLTIDGDAHVLGVEIKNLTPYTTYRVQVSIRGSDDLDSSSNVMSAPRSFSTLEDAPSSAPSQVRATMVTNSTISLQWDPPVKKNGKLKYYVVRFNNNSTQSDFDNITITNLQSYKTYSIQVQACTVKCSNFSEPLNVTTKMGYPGDIKRVSVVYNNRSVIVTGWDRPVPDRGRIDYYQVQIKRNSEYNNRTSQQIENVTTLTYNISDCVQDGNYDSFYISVRAVNIIDGKSYKGAFSKELVYYCVAPQQSFILIIVISFSILAFGFILWLLKKLYVCCKIMRDVEVKLPPGLTPIVDASMVQWPLEKHTEDIDRHSSAADEEFLLEKMTEGLSGESSGCSTAHDSVTSSIESANTHISGSDSGTEHRLSSVLNDDRRNSLRQRNVSAATRPTVNKGYVIMPPDAMMTTLPWQHEKSVPVVIPPSDPVQPGNYCVLGVDPTAKPEPPAPYSPVIATDMDGNFTTEDTSSQPPPYVMLRMKVPREELV